jgi:hypothetical protein
MMMLERPISSAANAGRLWHGYTAQKPRVLQKLLDIKGGKLDVWFLQTANSDVSRNSYDRATSIFQIGASTRSG